MFEPLRTEDDLKKLSLFRLPPLSLSHTHIHALMEKNYGEVSDNLPLPSAMAQLLESTTISKLRIYRTECCMYHVSNSVSKVPPPMLVRPN